MDTDKALASSDWRRRPLTQSQLYYSILDVSYLQHIAASLVDMLLDAPPAAPAAGSRARRGASRAHATSGADGCGPPKPDGAACCTPPKSGGADGCTPLMSGDANGKPSGACGANPATADVGTPCSAPDGGYGAAAAEAAGDPGVNGSTDGAAHMAGDTVGEAGDARAAHAAEGKVADGGSRATDQAAAPADGQAVQCARLASAWKRSQKLALTLYKPGAPRPVLES